ncbi:MAG: hypothetical protein SOW41_06175 [Anaerococcus sp.]|nr:hypothetical protein [Peptoniphilaceae bacterium]MDY3055618.1 hypothetical protein [Anaerococcus sp.]
MKLKKALICALSIGILAACGNQEAEEKPVEEPKSVEETQTEVKEEAKPEEKEEPVKEESQSDIITAPQQQIQDGPGETQKDKFLVLENDNLAYIQTGDAFIHTSNVLEDTTVLVIPMKFINKSVDQPLKPFDEFRIATKAIQYGEDVNYDSFVTLYCDDDYNVDIDVSVNKGGESEFYLMYTLKDPELGLSIIEKSQNKLIAEFIN